LVYLIINYKVEVGPKKEYILQSKQKLDRRVEFMSSCIISKLIFVLSALFQIFSYKKGGLNKS